MEKSLWEKRFPKDGNEYNKLKDLWKSTTNYIELKKILTTITHDEYGHGLSIEDVEQNIEYIYVNCVPDFFSVKEYYGVVIPHRVNFINSLKNLL